MAIDEVDEIELEPVEGAVDRLQEVLAIERVRRVDTGWMPPKNFVETT
jgi:hypothetical protein